MSRYGLTDKCKVARDGPQHLKVPHCPPSIRAEGPRVDTAGLIRREQHDSRKQDQRQTYRWTMDQVGFLQQGALGRRDQQAQSTDEIRHRWRSGKEKGHQANVPSDDEGLVVPLEQDRQEQQKKAQSYPKQARWVQ